MARPKPAENRRLAAELRARELGYRSLGDLLMATAAMPEVRMAELLQVRRSLVAVLRFKHGRPAPVAEPRGPAQHDGYLLCQYCGRWYRNLAVHIRMHSLEPVDYRRRFNLPDHQPLVAEAVTAAVLHSKSKIRFAGS